MLLRAEPERMMGINKARLPETQESDRRRAFLTDAALHFVNKKSLDALEKMVAARNPGLKGIDVSEKVFRPTFVLDTDEAWAEEEI